MRKISTLKIYIYIVLLMTLFAIPLCCIFEIGEKALLAIVYILAVANIVLFFFEYRDRFFAWKKAISKEISYDIQNNTKNLMTILNNMPVLAYIVDINYNIRACNAETIRYFDLKVEENGQINQLSADIFEMDTMEQMKEENELILKTKETFVTERPIKLKNGRQNWFIIRKVPILNKSGEVSKFVVLGRNIDVERNAQRQRETYISTLSHDLKIPTIAQIRALELIVNGSMGAINAGQKEILDLTLDSCYSMYDMLSTILSTYKYENNDVILNYEKFSILELMEQVFAKTDATLRGKNIKIHIVAKDRQDCIYADKVQMKKAFTNLIDFCVANAYQDTIISCEVEKNTLTNAVNVSLLYESPYIKTDSINNMFEMYTTSAEKFNKVGSSLNLYLAKQIITAHCGELNVDSKQSSYSRCSIVLPCFSECAVAC